MGEGQIRLPVIVEGVLQAGQPGAIDLINKLVAEMAKPVSLLICYLEQRFIAGQRDKGKASALLLLFRFAEGASYP